MQFYYSVVRLTDYSTFQLAINYSTASILDGPITDLSTIQGIPEKKRTKFSAP